MYPNDKQAETDMREALRPDDPTVVEALVENHRRFLRFVERRVGNPAVAEEILQNAFVKTCERREGFDGLEGAVTWFYRLLRNAIIDHHRSQAAQHRGLERQAQETANAADFQDLELRGEICACMNGLLATLKAEYSEIVRKVDLEERSIAEAASDAGITPNNAMVRLHRGRQALKRQLERSCGTCATHGCLDCSCGGQKGGGHAARSGQG